MECDNKRIHYCWEVGVYCTCIHVCAHAHVPYHTIGIMYVHMPSRLGMSVAVDFIMGVPAL